MEQALVFVLRTQLACVAFLSLGTVSILLLPQIYIGLSDFLVWSLPIFPLATFMVLEALRQTRNDFTESHRNHLLKKLLEAQQGVFAVLGWRIVVEWYFDKDNGQLEPFFLSTSLAIGVAFYFSSRTPDASFKVDEKLTVVHDNPTSE